METLTDFIFLGSQITTDSDCSHEIKRSLHLGRKAMTSVDSVLKNRDITLPTEVHIAKAMVFPVVMYRCEIWTTRKAEHWLILLNSGAGEGFWESLDLQEVKPVKPKRNQLWIFNASTDAEDPMLWPPDAKSWLIGKDPDAGKDWTEEKVPTEDEVVWWHHRLNEQFEQAPVVKDREVPCAVVHWMAKSQTRLSNWATNNSTINGIKLKAFPPGSIRKQGCLFSST